VPPAVIPTPLLRQGGLVKVHCVGVHGVHQGTIEVVTEIGIVLRKDDTRLSFFPFANIVEMEF
jgi:hypothetical protein